MLWNISPAHASLESDASSAVVFVYQRVGDDSSPQSSISVEQFREHIRELKTGGYTVRPLPEIIEVVRAGEPLPHKTVAITFEGGYSTVLANASPILEEAGYPYTVFYASDMVDSGAPGHMSWGQLEKLKKKKGVTLGILPAYYTHMVNETPERNAASINKAAARYREMFGEDAQFFAWPYGEYSLALKKQIESYNFKAVFGQQSGVVYPGADFLALPRFTMTDVYGDIDRFQLTANALPLPVSDITPEDPVLAQNPPMIGFTVSPEVAKDLSKISCFISDIGKVPLTRVAGGRTEIRLDQPFNGRRTRINCTLPDDTIIPGEAQNWRWFGMQFIDPHYTEEEETETQGLE